MKYFCFTILVVSLFLLTGCTEQPDILYKKEFNSFNSYYANGLSCYSTLGISLTGGNGAVNRQLNVSNFPFIVVVDTNYLNANYDYNVSLTGSSYLINFKSNVWNDQEIDYCLATSNTTFSNSVYLGSDATGLDGATSRVLPTNITNPLLVSVDNQLLSFSYDYTLLGGNVTFISNIWNDMVISVWG